jgi:hypothetical protein
MANLNELLIGLGFRVQASISTAPSVPGYWRVPNLNKKPWSQKVVNDDDRTEIGKGHEWPTQQWKSHYDNGSYSIERPASSEILAHVLGFGLGNVVVTGSTAPYTYTITPIVPASNPTGLELPYFEFIQQIRPGGSAVLDQLFTGCAIKGWRLSVKQGPGRLSAVVTADLVTSGLYTGTPTADSSGVTVPGPYAWHEMQSPSLSLSINGVNYVTAKNFVSVDVGWENNFRPGFFPGTALQDGFATQGRFECGDRTTSLNFVARFNSGSTELATLLALTSGEATMGLANGANDSFAGTWPALAFKTAELSDVDGIVTVAVTGEALYATTGGVFSAIVTSSTGMICT